LSKDFGTDEIPPILGLTSDSGAGTPESLAKELPIFDESRSCADSCELDEVKHAFHGGEGEGDIATKVDSSSKGESDYPAVEVN
jgi:hypothetical protein